jgi:hypothetical protein
VLRLPMAGAARQGQRWYPPATAVLLPPAVDAATGDDRCSDRRQRMLPAATADASTSGGGALTSDGRAASSDSTDAATGGDECCDRRERSFDLRRWSGDCGCYHQRWRMLRLTTADATTSDGEYCDRQRWSFDL